MSELEEFIQRRKREIKCGKKLWSSITFVAYFMVYISALLWQLQVE